MLQNIAAMGAGDFAHTSPFLFACLFVSRLDSNPFAQRVGSHGRGARKGKAARAGRETAIRACSWLFPSEKKNKAAEQFCANAGCVAPRDVELRRARTIAPHAWYGKAPLRKNGGS